MNQYLLGFLLLAFHLPIAMAVNNQTDFINALSAAPATISLTGSFTLDTPVTIPVGKTIAGGGHNITTTGAGNVTIPSNVRVTNLNINGVLNSTLNTAANGPLFNSVGGITTYNSGVNFSYNTATNNSGGGVFRLTGGATAIVNGNATFVGNRATFSTGGDGGVGAIDNSTLTINGDAQVHSNTASRHGGAFWNRYTASNLTFGSTSTFTNNTSVNIGGAIRNEGTIVFTGLATFNGNIAQTGGGIQAGGGNITFNNGATFINNTSTSTTTTQGGAAIRNASPANLTINNGLATFTGNQSGGFGGAIQNLGTLGQFTINSGAVFTQNRSTLSNGGAIHNASSGTINIHNGSTFTNNGKNVSNTTVTLSGGAIWNDANMTLSGLITFNSNASTTQGGALWTSGNSILNGVTTFSNNASGSGGAVYLGGGNLTFGNGVTFSSNTATNGGALATAGTATLTGTTVFNNNAASAGGAISNISGGNVNLLGNSSFISNTATNNGGAINNLNSTLTLTGDSTFTGNSSTAGSGGAIFNDPGTIVINGNTTFSNNSSALNGGAIANVISSTLRITGTSSFSSNSSSTGSGGAITTEDNSHTTLVGNSSFSSNTASLNGGAVNVADNSSFNALNGASFTGNTASTGTGGAIRLNNNATATLIANTSNVSFNGNTANGLSSGVSLGSNSTLNLNAGSAEVIFLDPIVSTGTNNVINLNRTGDWNTVASPNTPTGNGIPTTAPTTGNIRLNSNMSGFSGASNSVNLYGGSLYVGSTGTFFNNINFNAFNNTNLNLINNKIDTLNFASANFDNLNLYLDVNLLNNQIDNITAGSLTGNTVTIKGLNLLNDGSGGLLYVSPTNQLNINLDSTLSQVTGPVHIYNVSNNGNGALFIQRNGQTSPAVQASPTVKSSVVLNMIDNNRVALGRADEVMTFMDNILIQTGIPYHQNNKIAVLDEMPEYSEIYDRLESGALWYRPFSSFERIDSPSNGNRIDSTDFGMVLGYDSKLKHHGFGVTSMTTLFSGYNGSLQSYSNIDSTINGGYGGIMQAFFKGKFYATLMGTVGGNHVRERIANFNSTGYGMFNTSASGKIGYNLHLPKAIVMQLSGQITYAAIQGESYRNGQGTLIDPEMTHSIQVAPGIRITKNIHGWQPYIAAQWVMNPYQSAVIRVNEFAISSPALGDYVEYGVGLQKNTKSDVQTHLQAMARTGSRNGVNLELGIKIPVGRKHH